MPANAILSLEAALEGLAGAPVKLERPSRSEHGDYATNVALRLGPQNGRPPRELAEQLAREATDLDVVERADVAGPGTYAGGGGGGYGQAP